MIGSRVVVIGGGFAGVSCIRTLRESSSSLRLTLVDPARESLFRPLLPDVIAGKIALRRLLFPLKRFCADLGVEFVEAEGARLRDDASLLLAGGREILFDHLAIAAGADPAFYGNEPARKLSLTLYSAADAARLTERADRILAGERPHVFVVVGGGYTGLETATALAYRIRRALPPRRRSRFSVRIVELAPRILGRLGDLFALPAARETERMGIEILTSARIGEIAPDQIEINGEKIRDYTLLWSAGVKAADFIRTIDSPKDKQGRLTVQPDLRLPGKENIYALGDCASFPSPQGDLRMAVQFSWAQGAAAGRNILRRIRGEPALPYRPRDRGYLIPLASGKAWGEVMGTPVGGRLGSFLHYFMCIYRTHLFSARLGIVSDLFRALFPRVL